MDIFLHYFSPMVMFSIIKALILVFGFALGIQILRINEEKNQFQKKNLKTWIIFIGILTFCFVLFTKIGLLGVLFINLILFAGYLLLIFVNQKQRESHFRQEFVEFLDRLILYLKLGHGFSYSFDTANQKTSASVRIKIQKIYDSVLFNKKIATQSILATEIFELLTDIHLNSLKIINKLMAMRRRLRAEDRYRKQISTIVGQVWAQLLLILFLYIVVFCFLVHSFGFAKHKNIYLSSFVIYILGLFVFYFISRREIWKI